MTLFLWMLAFVASLAVLIISADYFTKGAEILGLKLKINPFIVGVTIVSIGTSLPELVTSFLAVARGETSLVVANAVGSNIANILLIVGLASVFAGTLVVRRSLIDLDAPLLAISTAITITALFDGKVVFFEAVILVITYIIYLGYTIKTGQTPHDEVDHLDTKIKKTIKESIEDDIIPKSIKMSGKKIALFLVLGAIGIYFGADWTITSVIEIGTMLGISASVIAITAIAFGTSLPELVVSISAAKKGSFEIALGNVFGSNIFNSLMVIGLPGLFTTLPLDAATLQVGLYFMATATLLYIFSGISKSVHRWEGLMYLTLYVMFVVKIFSGAI
jgi:cation:H+ antiporter